MMRYCKSFSEISAESYFLFFILLKNPYSRIALTSK